MAEGEAMTGTGRAREYRLISADGHVSEPRDLWESRVPTKWKDRVPHVEHRSDGDFWVVPGSSFPQMQLKELIPGAYDPKARLLDLDADGVDAEVLFPNSGPDFARADQDPGFHLAMVQVYNDFITEFAAVDPARFGACPIVPEIGIDAAIAEIERVGDRPGVVAWLLKSYPHGDTFLKDEDDPVWATIEQTGKPVTIHVGLRSTAAFNFATPLPGTLHFHDAPGRMLEIIFSGVLDRFPRLNFFFAEIDCGWLPYFAQLADDNYLRRTRAEVNDFWQTPKLRRLPSDYMKERFPASFITDPFAVKNRHAVGVQRMLWSSDYPHLTTDWPNSWKTVHLTFADVPDDERYAILAGNAERLFGFR
jgi:predicted TIM-barrel fold metal-dependent hydrolase